MKPTSEQIWAEAENWRKELIVVCRRKWKMSQEDAEDAASDAIAKVADSDVLALKAVRQMLHRACGWLAVERHRRSVYHGRLKDTLLKTQKTGKGAAWLAHLCAGAEGAPSEGDARGRGVPSEFQCTEVLLLREALESVRVEYAEAIMLAYWRFSQQEAAEKLGISVICYKSRLYRAREAVKLAMGEGWAELDICREYLSMDEGDRTQISAEFRRKHGKTTKSSAEPSKPLDAGVSSKS